MLAMATPAPSRHAMPRHATPEGHDTTADTLPENLFSF